MMRNLLAAGLAVLFLVCGSARVQQEAVTLRPEPGLTPDRHSTGSDTSSTTDPGHLLMRHRNGGILYAPTEDDDADFRAALSAGCGGVTVDYLDARIDTPSVEFLSNYDCVFTWTNFDYADFRQFADNLVAYVDGGGKVILGQWSFSGLGGLLASAPAITQPEYCPVFVESWSSGTYAGDGETCLHEDVVSYSSPYRDDCTLQGEGQQDGSFTDGRLSVAYRPDFRVIYSAGNTGWEFGTGDWVPLLCNMCSCPEAGDFDADGDIDLDDYADWEACATGPAMGPYPLECALLDFDADEDVDLVDFAEFQLAFDSTIPVVITQTELAGNSLSEYPFFEYVKAFNEDATIEVAVDPTRFPQIVGQTCDIYVVEAKTGAQWWVDPSLTDVTPGGTQTETFAGSTIQENTFTVTGPYGLDSDAGIGLGVGYDVVLDCDQDGQLGGGDYIDGRSNEAGLYVVHDTTQPGPLAVTEILYSVGPVFGIPSGFTNQNTYYPTDIASLGQLPLIVISPAGSDMITWYDHFGYHFASYGYIVMSHQNNDGPGVQYASLTTLGHTEAIIDQQDTIDGGVLEGHIDSSRIIWIGRVRGGEGVVRAYDRVYKGEYTPATFTLEDIILVSSITPTDFLKESGSNPHNVPFVLWTASGDADVNGSAGCDLCQTFHLHDRATGFRHSIVLQGVGNGDFHAASGSVFCGGCPCHVVPKEKIHDIILGYFLPLIKYYTEGNIPATDYFWRQYERFHPNGVDLSDPCIVVSSEYRNGADDGNFMIDDYQTEYDDTHTSSSGGSVSYTVQNLTEGRLDDNNTTFTWTASDPFNGATQASTDGEDDSRGVVFDWTDEDLYYEWQVVSEWRNLSDDLYLSFRGAQGTQHPNTLAVLGDLTFSVTLRDGDATTSSINIGAYGGGLEQPYQREGGWHNEMEVIRIRLTDFLTNGSGLDLTDVVAVRLDVGPSWGSSEGRIVIDELMLTNDHPAFFVPLTLSLPDGAPEFLPPGVPTVIPLEINEGSDGLVPGTALLHYRFDGGAFLTEPLTLISGTMWQATLPPPSCGDSPEFYCSAEGEIAGVVYQPTGAPASPFVAYVGTRVTILDDNFETDQGWTVENIDLTDGPWERALPSTDGSYDEPTEDYDGSGHCYVTENVYHAEVDGGPTRLISPTLDLSTVSNPVLRYARWWANDDQDGDPFDVEISNDDGDTWVLIESVANIDPGWVEQSVSITDTITPLTDVMRIRFSATDNPNNSKDEGGVDAVEVFNVQCP